MTAATEQGAPKNSPEGRRFWLLWRDKQGRFSWLHLCVLLICLAPIASISFNAYTLGLSLGFVRPNAILATIIYHSGTAMIWLLLLALAITPLRRLTGYSRLLSVRRMIGVSAFLYALVHLAVYVPLRSWDVAIMLNEAGRRITIMVALVALAGILVLAATSTDAAVRWLGDNWGRLHRLVYPATGLAILHFVMTPDAFGGEAFIMMGLFFWLMGWRIVQRFDKGAAPGALALMTLCAAALTVGFEFVALMVFKGMTPAETAEVNYAIQPLWSSPVPVLAVGLVAMVLAGLSSSRRRRLSRNNAR